LSNRQIGADGDGQNDGAAVNVHPEPAKNRMGYGFNAGGWLGTREVVMKEDTFNIEVRKFLKEVGVTSQREIESAVRKALEAGQIEGDAKLKAVARIQIESIGLDHRVEGKIALS
jgi:hypothetical protein